MERGGIAGYPPVRMAYVVGIVLAAVLCAFGTIVGLDRERGFYPTQMIVIALLYGLFAAMSGSTQVLMMESIGIILFILAAVIGFKTNLWIVAVALAAHGVYDFLHPRLFHNPGAPLWWPAFCGAYDVVAGIYLGLLLNRQRVASSPVGR
jgi:hypothetical protein